MIELFVHGAYAVLDAIGSDRVGEAWNTPSVLEGQLVSGVAGHLARGGVWVVGDYLDGETPTGSVDFESAAHYFAGVAGNLTDEEHQSIRQRGAEVAAMGRPTLVETLADRLAALETRLRSEPGDRLVAVIGGRAMRLDDYLVTRIVEQTVHLDDLARSVGHAGWPVPAEAEALVITVGAEIGRLNSGGTAMVRALYRDGFAEPTLPVL